MKLNDKLKRIKLKDIILCFLSFLICFLITGGVAVTATSLITSREVSYDNSTSGLDSETVQDAIDELWINNCQNIFKVGDYVQMTPTLSSYTTEPKYTGYSSTQTITPTELNLWRVIRTNSDGTVDAVSEYVSSRSVAFNGTVGYQSIVGYLNILASKYENPKYTVGSRYMGYNGQTEFISDTSYFDGTRAIPSWPDTSNNTSAMNEHLGSGDYFNKTDDDLLQATYGGSSSSCLVANKVGTTTATEYWESTRRFARYANGPVAFCGYYIRTFGAGFFANLRRASWSGGTLSDTMGSYYLRPIITLRFGLSPTGSGTSDDPYVLP